MENKIKKIIFFGTPEHASRVLQAFIDDANIEVCAVVTNPDRPVGRKKILTSSSVKNLAQKFSIPVLQPEKCDENFSEELKKFDADFFAVVAYGTIMPQEVLDIPKLGAFNLHFSLLPKYRGATPIQSALLAGEKISGISIFKLVLAMDAGEIFASQEIPLFENISGEKKYPKNHLEVWDEMVVAGKKIFVDLFTNFENFSGVSQDETQATFCSRFTKSDGEIFPIKDFAQEILQKYRGYFIWPGIFSFDSEGKRIQWKKISEYKIHSNSSQESFPNHPAGTLFEYEKKCLLQTADGVLEIIRLQKEGKKECDASSLNGDFPRFL